MGLQWVDRLNVAVGGKRVPAPDPPGRRSFGSEREPDVVRAPLVDDRSAAWSAFVTYTNAAGEESARVISLRAIGGHFGKPETVRAYCHLREEWRTFRIDRMTSMACAETGEDLDPLEQCLALHNSGALKIEDKALTRVMRILMFMARCDGELHRLERSALEDVLGRYFRFFGGDDSAYDCAVTEAPRLRPSGDQLVKALRWVKRAPLGGELCRFILDSSGTMIDADGRHATEELSWGLEVSDALKRTAARST